MGRKKMKKSDFNLRSKCCNASVRTESGIPDFIGDKNPRIATMWYVCSQCDQPCDTQKPGGYQPLFSNLDPSRPPQGGSGILMVDNLKESKLFVKQPIAPLNVTHSWSATITKVDNGFLIESLEELSGDDNVQQYHKVQTVFQSDEYAEDDLESFQELVFHLTDYFGVTSGTSRRLDIEIYDPDAKPNKKGKK